MKFVSVLSSTALHGQEGQPWAVPQGAKDAKERSKSSAGRCKAPGGGGGRCAGRSSAATVGREITGRLTCRGGACYRLLQVTCTQVVRGGPERQFGQPWSCLVP